jgi:hypothetical protein
MASLLLSFTLNYVQPEYECVRWTWSGDIYERKVVCLEWRKKEKKRV